MPKFDAGDVIIRKDKFTSVFEFKVKDIVTVGSVEHYKIIDMKNDIGQGYSLSVEDIDQNYELEPNCLKRKRLEGLLK